MFYPPENKDTGLRFNLRFKIFSILLATSLTIVCVMLAFILFSFETEFSVYVEDIGVKRVEALALRLGQEYGREESFDFLKTTPEVAEKLEILVLPDLDRDQKAALINETLQEMDPDYFPVFFVLNTDRKLVFGYWDSRSKSRLVPIISGNGQVGWVGVHDLETDREDDQEFIRSLSLDFLVISGLVMFCAAIAAIFAATHFQRPIQILVRGTRALTSGDYKVRVPENARDELGDLSRNFNKLAATLEENEAARKQWVEDISHELKTPLTLMGGELEAVRDGVRKLSPETLDLLARDVDHLTALVNDLNDLWKSESGRIVFAFHPVDIGGIINKSAAGFKARFAERRIDVILPETRKADPHAPYWVSADADRLRQVFDNLFQNSLKYTAPEGRVRAALQARGAELHISVEDTSPGVPEEKREKIFRRLYRVDPSRNRALGGAGIGLALCKHIIRAHNGSIHAYPSPLGGLGISIQLPLIKETQTR